MDFIIPLDNFKEIFLLCDFLTQIRFRQTCKFLYNFLQIIDFYNIETKYLTKLNEDILKNYKYIKYLNVKTNRTIKDISWMVNLKILDASDKSRINQIGIKELDLIELNVWNNQKIIDVSWMKNLKILNASNKSGINQIGIKGLDLIELNVWNNRKIKDVSFMTNLKELDAGFDSRIDQMGINGLDLIKLDIWGNPKIIDKSWMKNLKEFNIKGSNSGIKRFNKN